MGVTMTGLTPDEVRARAIIAGVFDPDQEHIDTAWENITQGVKAEWYRMSFTGEIRHAYADLDRDTLESRLAFEWRKGIEKSVKLEAWRAQNHADKIAAMQSAARGSEGSMAAMQHVIELHRQGRKTVKIADLLDLYKEAAHP